MSKLLDSLNASGFPTDWRNQAHVLAENQRQVIAQARKDGLDPDEKLNNPSARAIAAYLTVQEKLAANPSADVESLRQEAISEFFAATTPYDRAETALRNCGSEDLVKSFLTGSPSVYTLAKRCKKSPRRAENQVLEAAKLFLETIVKTSDQQFDYDAAMRFVSHSVGRPVDYGVVVRSLNQLKQRGFFEKKKVEGTNKFQVSKFNGQATTGGVSQEEQDRVLGVRTGVSTKNIIDAIILKIRNQASFKIKNDPDIREFFTVFNVSSQTTEDRYIQAKKRVLLATRLHGSVPEQEYVALLDTKFGSCYRDYLNRLLLQKDTQ